MPDGTIEREGKSVSRAVVVSIYWISILIGLINYGAVEIQTVAILCIPIYLLVATTFFIDGIPSRTRHAVTAAVVLLLSVFGWVGFQTTPWPYGVFGNPAWQDIRSYVPSVDPTVSLTPSDDWTSVLRIALPLGVFLLALRLFDTDDRAVGALKVLAISGGAVSILSIFQFELAPSMLVFWPKIAYLDSLTAFFVNRNTAATYLGLVALVNLALVLQDVEKQIRKQANPIGFWRKREMLSTVCYALGFMAAVAALMLTRSRAGLLSGAIAMALLVAFQVFGRSHPARSANPFAPRRSGSFLRKVMKAALILLVLFLLLQVFGSRTLLRVEAQGLDDSRFCVMPGILSAIGNQLPWGSGLSSFEDVFTAYRDPACGVYGLWNRAHNFYLEGAFTLGLGFAVLLAGALGTLIYMFRIGLRNRRGLRFAPEMGISALLLIAIHSAFDFSLQISGMAVVVAALFAPLISVSLNQPGKRSSQK